MKRTGPSCSNNRRLAAARLIAGTCLVCAASLGRPMEIHATESVLRGQLSAWITGSVDDGERFHNGGIRYIPQYSLRHEIAPGYVLDFEASLNAWAAFGGAEDDDDADVEPYRIAVGFAARQTDMRVGLQKMSFGPAFLLRALMWFDSLDPRDPLQLTGGVYGARVRYVTANNASLWLWGLYGNDDLKGIEVLPSEEERPEFGGRLQLPVPAGEIAFTYHNREVNGARFYVEDYVEHRYALDAKWDVEIGLWFEAVLQQQSIETGFIAAIPGAADLVGDRSFLLDWVKVATIGADYTIDIGNGVHILCEHLAYAFSDEPFGWEDDRQTSAYSINYPIGYLDSVSAIGFYSWEAERYYQYLAWQRTWDDLILSLSLFHYPDSNLPGGVYNRSLLGTGYGGQVTVIYNH